MTRLVIHVDLDAFYAQVEHQRLQIPPQQPLAVQQWSRVIAVNYPARHAGIRRHCSVQECRLKCPSVSLVHVATMSILDKEGPEAIRFHAANNMDGVDIKTCKASLEPYRKASKDIFASVRAFFQDHERVIIERASVDEAFIEVPLDFINNYHGEGQCFIGNPVVSDAIQNDNSNSNSNINEQSKVIQIGTIIANDLRMAIKSQLGYTMSAGIAKNKTLAKLASGKFKPDNQTYVLDVHVIPLMKQTLFSKIRFLGGKLGNSLKEDNDDSLDDDQEEAELNASLPHEQTAFELQSKSMEELRVRVGDSAEWVYNVIRGEDLSAVVDRSLVKSFMSVKQFRPPLQDLQLLHKWIKLLCSELAIRMQDEYDASRRWPSTITLHWRQPGNSARSKAHHLADVNQANASILYEHVCKRLLSVCLKRPKAVFLPVRMIGLSVSRFTHSKEGGSMSKYLSGNVASGEAIFEFQKPSTTRPNNSTRWHCCKCSVWYELHEADKIQQHKDHHLAMELARQM